MSCDNAVSRVRPVTPSCGAAMVDDPDGLGPNRAGSGTFRLSLEPRIPVSCDELTVFAFSQTGTNEIDSQLFELEPDIVIRGWQRWDVYGTNASDYNAAALAELQAADVRFVGGTTASVVFARETDPARFERWATRDARGNLVPHDNIVPGAHRASLANPDYRRYLVDIAKLQIDAGVNGLSFDELNASYLGQNLVSGDEGFDDYDLADFNAFLLAKYPGVNLAERFAMRPGNLLDSRVLPYDLQNGFDYRCYLEENGWQAAPFATQNPLAAEWGRTIANRPDPDATSFVDNAVMHRYWREIADEVRAYATERYGRDLYLTSNGLFPYVDFQSVGLYDGNLDGPGRSQVDYVPVVKSGSLAGHLDGRVSLAETMRELRTRGERLAPGAPLVLFLDWPNAAMDRYNALPTAERADYFRLYGAEAYANGMFFAFHLRTTTGEPTATEAGTLGPFKELAAFYRSHTKLYHGVTLSSRVADFALPSTMVSVMEREAPRALLVHLVNHEYEAGFVEQAAIPLSVPLDSPPVSVTLASPDLVADEELPFDQDGGVVAVTVPRLVAYDVVVIAY